MKENKIKPIIITLLIVAVLIIGIIIFEQIKKENIVTSQYIGIDSCFLGEYSEGKWYSANEFYEEALTEIDFKINAKINVNKKDYTYQEILNQKTFYLYSGNAENLVLEEKSDELFYDIEEYPEYYADINLFRFNLPNGFGGDGTLYTSQELLNLNKNGVLEITDYQEYEKYIKEILIENEIEEAVNISKIVEVDANEDGIKEIYILACSPQTNWDDLKDIYNLLVKVEDGNSQIIMQKFIQKEEFETKYNDATLLYTSIYSINFADFNNDGKMEMYVKTFIWDNPYIYVFNYNASNELELCMYGNFAW